MNLFFNHNFYNDALERQTVNKCFIKSPKSDKDV